MRSGTLRQKVVPLLLLASSAAAFAGTTDAAEKWPDQLALGGSELRHWLDPDWQHPTPLSSNLTTPLGSVWKLFVYDYLQATHAQEAPLRCSGQQPEEERYCCDPGESIDRDQALIRSCGLYFSPDRLKLSPRHGVTTGNNNRHHSGFTHWHICKLHSRFRSVSCCKPWRQFHHQYNKLPARPCMP